MTNEITVILDEILAFLSRWQFPVVGFLQHGLNKDLILELFSNINLQPTNELLQLYAWKNGVNVVEGINLDDIQFVPGYHILSLEGAIAQYIAVKGDPRWDRSWFPVMANGGGDFYVIDLAQSDGESAPVIGFLLGEEEQDTEYQSIAAMLHTFFECYKKGIVYRSEEGYLEMDDDKHALVAKMYNPSVEFWQV